MGRDQVRIGRGLVAVIAVLAMPTAAAAQTQSDVQTACIVGLNRAGFELGRAIWKDLGMCLRRGADGRLPAGTDAQDCITGDYAGRRGTAEAATTAFVTDACGEWPDFGATSAATVNDNTAAEKLGFVGDLFGDDLGAAVSAAVGDGAAVSCQRALRRAAAPLANLRARRFIRCKKRRLARGTITSADGLADCLSRVESDHAGKLAAAVAAFDLAVARSCAGMDRTSLAPGACATSPSMGACLAERAACRSCRTFSLIDDFTADCDALDDGLANASCESPHPPTPLPICGNGTVETGEDCDDGNPMEGDCCSSTCKSEASGRSCASDGVACTLDVCDGAGACSHQFTCEWRFTDVTEQAGLTYTHDYDRALYDGPTLDRAIIGGGVAAGDYDGDGWVDLYAVGGPLSTNHLLRNMGDGTFEDVAATAGVDLPGTFGSGPTFADYDGDGDLDLIVGGMNGTPVTLFANQGDGTFDDVTAASGIDVDYDTFSAAFGDYDGDGDLDLCLTHWQQPIDTSARLWRNQGDGTFTNVTAEAGLDVGRNGNPLDWSFTCNFADIDDDGDLDLLISGDFGNSQVFTNDDDGTFTDATTAVISDQNGMGGTVGDYDEDGDLDWFVSSIWDPNGVAEANWGTTGSRLYRNTGGGVFEDATDEAGVRQGYWGWGSCFADFDLDGHLDLFHTNGYSTNSATEYFEDPSRLFLSNGDGTFAELSSEVLLDDTGQGRGVVCFDYDLDGDVDIFVANNGQSPRLWQNNATTGLRNGFLHLELRAPAPNTEAIGARVYVTANGETQMREIRAGSNFESQDPAVAEFGVAEAALVDEIRVAWPDGEETVLTDEWPSQRMRIDHPALAGPVAADTRITLVEPLP